MLQWLSNTTEPAGVAGITEAQHEGVVTASFGHYPTELGMWAAWVPVANLPITGLQLTERMVDKEAWGELFPGKRPVPAHYVAVFSVDSDTAEEGSESDADKEDGDEEESAPAAKKARSALAQAGDDKTTQ